MTEDDTFRILKRPAFTQLYDRGFSFKGYIFRPFTEHEVKKLQELGWSELEYKLAHGRHLSKPMEQYFWCEDYFSEIERLENESKRKDR